MPFHPSRKDVKDLRFDRPQPRGASPEATIPSPFARKEPRSRTKRSHAGPRRPRSAWRSAAFTPVQSPASMARHTWAYVSSEGDHASRRARRRWNGCSR